MHGPEHSGHEELQRRHDDWVAALRAWRVAIRIHLLEVHGVEEVLLGDPERVHYELHEQDVPQS
jgi:hypothetical protein